MEPQSQPPDNLIIQRSRPISGHFLWEDWLAGDTVQLCPLGSLALANPGFPIHPDIGTLAHCEGILCYVFDGWHSIFPRKSLNAYIFILTLGHYAQLSPRHRGKGR